jgi:hypothetical protein
VPLVGKQEQEDHGAAGRQERAELRWPGARRSRGSHRLWSPGRVELIWKEGCRHVSPVLRATAILERSTIPQTAITWRTSCGLS